MGRRCGYLTLMSALSSGAEYMYINEESPSLEQIAADADRMVASFKSGRRLFLTLLNESASQYYDREFLADVFNAESEGIGNAVEARPVKNMFDDLDIENRRPFVQWWRDLVPVQRIVSLQNPGIEATPIPIDDPVA